METSWVNYYSGLLLVISYNLLLKSFYTAEQSFWLYLQLSYRSSVKYKKKIGDYQCSVAVVSNMHNTDPWRLMHIIYVIAHLPTSLSIWHDVLILHSYCSFTMYIHLECYLNILLKWLYRKHYWPTCKRFLSWYVWSLFCSVGGGSHPLHK